MVRLACSGAVSHRRPQEPTLAARQTSPIGWKPFWAAPGLLLAALAAPGLLLAAPGLLLAAPGFKVPSQRFATVWVPLQPVATEKLGGPLKEQVL